MLQSLLLLQQGTLLLPLLFLHFGNLSLLSFSPIRQFPLLLFLSPGDITLLPFLQISSLNKFTFLTLFFSLQVRTLAALYSVPFHTVAALPSAQSRSLVVHSVPFHTLAVLSAVRIHSYFFNFILFPIQCGLFPCRLAFECFSSMINLGRIFLRPLLPLLNSISILLIFLLHSTQLLLKSPDLTVHLLPQSILQFLHDDRHR